MPGPCRFPPRRGLGWSRTVGDATGYQQQEEGRTAANMVCGPARKKSRDEPEGGQEACLASAHPRLRLNRSRRPISIGADWQ